MATMLDSICDKFAVAIALTRDLADTKRVIERFDGFWLYGSRVRVQMALRDTRDSFWRKKRSDEKRIDIGLTQNHSDQMNAQKQYLKLPSKLVEGVVDGDKLDIL
ncbi:hypothetical protein V6N11_072779 [Hibiscus sabdariffa]|uniref:Uncharacterized protein n=2 Tax=Hibiscus sabdariffa TaxID=183260 RepID=A0ABR2NE87_9ROSI